MTNSKHLIKALARFWPVLLRKEGAYTQSAISLVVWRSSTKLFCMEHPLENAISGGDAGGVDMAAWQTQEFEKQMAINDEGLKRLIAECYTQSYRSRR